MAFRRGRGAENLFVSFYLVPICLIVIKDGRIIHVENKIVVQGEGEKKSHGIRDTNIHTCIHSSSGVNAARAGR